MRSYLQFGRNVLLASLLLQAQAMEAQVKITQGKVSLTQGQVSLFTQGSSIPAVWNTLYTNQNTWISNYETDMQSQWTNGWNVSAATNSNPIQITTATPSRRQTGDTVTISGVGGNTNANGTWTVTRVDDSNFTVPVAGNGNYTSGGIVGQPVTKAFRMGFEWQFLSALISPTFTPSTVGPFYNATALPQLNMACGNAAGDPGSNAKLVKFLYHAPMSLIDWYTFNDGQGHTGPDYSTQFTVSGATNANPIVITTTANHGLTTGQTVNILGVGGNTAANNPNNQTGWTVTVLSPTTFSIPATGNGSWTSGGTVWTLPLFNALQQYYQQGIVDAKARGCKVDAQAEVAGASGASVNNPNLQYYYNSLTWAQYQSMRARQAIFIANLATPPDRLTIWSEPDQETNHFTCSGTPPTMVPDVCNYLDLSVVGNATFLANVPVLLNYVLSQINANNAPGLHTSIKVYAGFGAWITPATALYTGLQSAFIGAQYADGMTIHVHPMNAYPSVPASSSYLRNIQNLASQAIAAGESVALNESEADHSTVAEQAAGVSRELLDTREVMSFWAPIYQNFALSLYYLGHYLPLDYVSIARIEEASSVLDWYGQYNLLSCLQFGPAPPNNNGAQCSSTQLSNINSTQRAVIRANNASPPAPPPTLTGNGAYLKALFGSWSN